MILRRPAEVVVWTQILFLFCCSLLPSLTDATWMWLAAGSKYTPVVGDNTTSFQATAPWPARFSQQAVATASNGIFLMGGSGAELYNDVWNFDGTQWTSINVGSAFSPREEFTLTPFGSSLYLIGGMETTTARTGTTNDVWAFDVSAKTFSLSTAAAAFPPRHSHCTFVLNNIMYVVGGKGDADASTDPFNDVWSWTGLSTDTWNQQPDADFKPRYGHFAQAYNGSIFLTGGYDDTNYFQDIWQFDGSSWNSLLPGAFSPRIYSQSLLFQGTWFVLGGQTKSVPTNDVYNFDLSSWSRQSDGKWSSRSKFSAIANPFADGSSNAGESLLVMGGVDKTGHYSNDVWILKDIHTPTAPSSVTARAIQSADVKIASDTVEVSWIVPTLDGGAPISMYKIKNSFDDTFVLINATTPSPYIVTGLSIGVNYSFSMTSINLAGEGLVSNASNLQQTAAAGYLINWGGKIVSTTSTTTTEAAASDSIVTKSWFIATMVILSVAVLVTGCIIFVWRYLRKAKRDLIKLDEIEALDDTSFAIPGVGGSADGVVDLAELGISGIAKRDKAMELHEWRNAELKNQKYQSSNEALKRTLDRSLVAPLGFTIGGEEEEEAIERLGAEMEKLDREDRENIKDIFPSGVPKEIQDSVDASSAAAAAFQEEEKYPDAAGAGSSLTPSSSKKALVRPGSAKSHAAGQSYEPPSEDTIRERCEECSEYLCDLLSVEYTKRIMANPLHPRLMTTEPLQNLLAHAFYASGALKHMATDAFVHQKQRQELVQYLQADLMDHVSTDAADERERVANNGKAMGAEDGLGDANETYLFLRARSCMLRWMFEQVKQKRERQKDKMDQLAKFYGRGLIVGADGKAQGKGLDSGKSKPSPSLSNSSRTNSDFPKLSPPPSVPQRSRFSNQHEINEEGEDEV